MPSLPALLRLPLCCHAGVGHDGPGGARHPEDCAREDTLLSPRALMAERVVLTPADPAQSARCRGAHNRLGLAYHMAFRRLTGRFPSQHPLELVPDGLALVASELALAPTVLEAYAQRQATVAAPQEPSRLPLGCPAFGPTAREALSQVWREEARPLDHLAALVNAMLALDTPQVWGDGSTASSDGQRLLFPQRGLRRTSSPRMGAFALEFSPFIADHYAPFYTVPIACTARDAPEVLDGLLYQESDLAPQAHYTDTPGYLALNFAALPMFGKRFCPRIRGLHRQWMYRIDPQKASGPLTPLVSQTKRALHLGWSTAHWDRMGQFFASCAAGQPTASVARKRLLACGPRNPFSRAVRALGRVGKTMGILAYLTVPARRRRVRRGLLKGEQLQALARHVHYGKRGHTEGRDGQQPLSRASCLGLILAAIIYWQIREIDTVLRHGAPVEEGMDPAWLPHISPLGWDNVIL